MLCLGLIKLISALKASLLLWNGNNEAGAGKDAFGGTVYGSFTFMYNLKSTRCEKVFPIIAHQ